MARIIAPYVVTLVDQTSIFEWYIMNLMRKKITKKTRVTMMLDYVL